MQVNTRWLPWPSKHLYWLALATTAVCNIEASNDLQCQALCLRAHKCDDRSSLHCFIGAEALSVASAIASPLVHAYINIFASLLLVLPSCTAGHIRECRRPRITDSVPPLCLPTYFPTKTSTVTGAEGCRQGRTGRGGSSSPSSSGMG